MDVMRWEGQIDVFDARFQKWKTHSIGSWDKMTDCTKGFSIWMDQWAYEVGACEPGCKGPERYTLET